MTPEIPVTPAPVDADPTINTFEGLFSESIDFTPAPVTPQEPIAPEPITPADTDEKRYQYWQSETQKAQARNAELEYIKPVADILAERPDIAKTIETMLKSDGLQPVVEPLQKPILPPKPPDYDPVSAVTDPDGTSAKWMKAQAEYQEQLVQYLEKKDALRDQVIQEREQRNTAREQESQRMARVRVDLAKRGLTQSEAEEFIKFSSNPRVELDTVLSVWRASKADPAVQAEKLKKEAELKKRMDRMETPLPGLGGGNPPPPVERNDSDQFSDSMIAYANRFKKK
jgi:hypothetical protein